MKNIRNKDTYESIKKDYDALVERILMFYGKPLESRGWFDKPLEHLEQRRQFKINQPDCKFCGKPMYYSIYHGRQNRPTSESYWCIDMWCSGFAEKMKNIRNKREDD